MILKRAAHFASTALVGDLRSYHTSTSWSYHLSAPSAWTNTTSTLSGEQCLWHAGTLCVETAYHACTKRSVLIAVLPWQPMHPTLPWTTSWLLQQHRCVRCVGIKMYLRCVVLTTHWYVARQFSWDMEQCMSDAALRHYRVFGRKMMCCYVIYSLDLQALAIADKSTPLHSPHPAFIVIMNLGAKCAQQHDHFLDVMQQC